MITDFEEKARKLICPEVFCSGYGSQPSIITHNQICERLTAAVSDALSQAFEDGVRDTIDLGLAISQEKDASA